MSLLRVREVAEQLGCSAAHVYQLIDSGRLRHYAVGFGRGGKRVSEAQLAEFLRDAESPTPALRLKHLRASPVGRRP